MADNSEKSFLKSVSEIQGAISSAGKSITDFSGSLGSAFDSLGSIGGSLEAGIAGLEKLSASTGTLRESMNALGNGEAFAQIAEVLGGMGGAIDSFSSMLAPFGQGIAGAFSVFNSISGMVSSAGEKIIGYIGELDSGLGSTLQPILEKVIGFSTTFLNCLNFAAGLGLVAAGLGLLYQMYGEQIDQLLTMVTEKGPMIITNLCNGIILALPGLIEQGAILMNGLMLAITANLPAVIGGGISIISSLITGIAQQLPMLIPTAVGLVLTLVQSLISNLPLLIDAGLNLLTGVVQGILNSIPVLVASAPTLIGSLASGIISKIPQIIDTGIKLIFGLATGLIQAIPQIVGSIPQIIDAIKRAFREVDWGEVGMNIIKGVKEGILSMGNAIFDVLKQMVKSAIKGIKDLLGINSPSRVFRDEIGKMMALGMGIGFEKNIPVHVMGKGIDSAIGRLKKDIGIAAAVVGPGVNSTKAGNLLSLQSGIFDFDEYERRQRKLNRERDERPVFLNSRQINRAIKKGELVTI